VTWATSVAILVFLGLSVLDLGQMHATDRRQTDARRQTKASLNAPRIWGGGIINNAKLPGEDTVHLKRVKTVSRLRHRPGPRWESLQLSSRPPSWGRGLAVM